MSFSGNATCTSFKADLLARFATDTFKIALYTSAASLDANTTVYSATNEVSGAGYTAGGGTLVAVAAVTSGTTALCDFDDYTFSGLTATSRGALIYNTSDSNKAVCVLDFGRDIVRVAQDLVITFPTPDALNAIIKIR